MENQYKRVPEEQMDKSWRAILAKNHSSGGTVAMNKHIVFTLTGHDRVGLVEEVMNLMVKHGGNVETSRMARLGGEFAMLALVTLEEKDLAGFESDLHTLRDEGFQIALSQTQSDHAKKFAGWLPYQIEVIGADHEGIIYEIARHLAGLGINIEDVETTTTPAPMSGTTLFRMEATFLVPPQLPVSQWSESLEEIGDKLNVTLKVTMVK
jgi:glycine cleavage system transcriptional repressor